MNNNKNYISLHDCKKGFLYKIAARNFEFGVFDGKTGFIGIREKFGNKFLFTEYHWDSDPYNGTVKPLKITDIQIPNDYQLLTNLGTKDQITERKVYFDKPISDGGRGWCFVDTNEANKSIRPVSIPNSMLYHFLNIIVPMIKEHF